MDNLFIPPVVKISGVAYKIAKTEGKPLLVNGRECQARITYSDALIELDAGFLTSPQAQGYNLCHEIVHGWVKDRRLEIPEEIEEHIVDSLGRALFAFLIDNDLWFKDPEDDQPVPFNVTPDCPPKKDQLGAPFDESVQAARFVLTAKVTVDTAPEDSPLPVLAEKLKQVAQNVAFAGGLISGGAVNDNLGRATYEIHQLGATE